MSDNADKQQIIENYIRAYNGFDVEKMLRDMDERIVFRNIANGAVNLETNGVDEFRTQAEQAKTLFSQREQKITKLNFADDDEAEVEIAYRATLAVDLPNGLQTGSRIEIAGKSIFRFAGDKIIEIEDIS
jgi:hypothetical protein